MLSPSLSSRWVGLVTPLPSDLARPLVDSLVNEVVADDAAIREVVPRTPLRYREAVEVALRRVRELEVSTTWADAELRGRTPADPLPADPGWSGGTVLRDVQEVEVDAPPEVLHHVVCGIGGDRGWLAGGWLWTVRGWMDRVVGGIGMRRGRRHPDQLRVGDPVDFWRVEALEPGRLLRLRAEMRLPGEAWLEWRIEPRGRGSLLHQQALFHPRGLAGRALLGPGRPVPPARVPADGRAPRRRRRPGGVDHHLPLALRQPSFTAAYQTRSATSTRVSPTRAKRR